MNKPGSLVKDGKLTIPSPDVLGFDPQELRHKYNFERDRRLRPEGAAPFSAARGSRVRLAWSRESIVPLADA